MMRAWQAGIAWIERAGGAVWDALTGAVQALADWMRGPAPGTPPAEPTEPGRAGARSTQ
jgi:hypothetical protein